TQTDLALALGVTQSAVAHIEAGRVFPSDELMARLSTETPFPAAFYGRRPCEHFPMGSLQFRARKKVTMAQRRQAYQYARLSYEMFEDISRGVMMPPVRIRPHDGEPERLAEQVRAMLGVSDQAPIANLTLLLERAGIVVLALPIALPERDGFSGWADGGRVPVIVMPRHRHGDRGRFTMAHELGELLYAALPPGDERERKADEFASNLMLPPQAIRREFSGGSVTLTSLAMGKRRWKMSMAALAMATKRLGVVSDRHYRTLVQHMAAKGWKTAEPAALAVVPEKPRALRKAIELKYGEAPNYPKMARDLGLSVFMLREIVSAYASKADLAGVKGVASSPITNLHWREGWDGEPDDRRR
ncbi:MAG: ImmA/IrrE family metallo-endopeptidase, partial [Candidatus Eremiobacteraeota bacterium]|nr:ImmA/IrrE family metallo-endopeptidase [Candidatus Eremiobacteraeota bacterium]